MKSQEISWEEPDIEELKSAYSMLDADPVHALQRLRALETRGSIASLIYIGYIFEKGLGVERNLSEARSYYQRSYEAGDAEGLFRLGVVSLNLGDCVAAERALSVGAERQDPRSLCWLAHVYLRTATTAEQRRRVVELLEQASSLGYLAAQRHLAWFLMTGRLGLSGVFRGLWIQVRSAVVAGRIAARNPHDERLKDIPL